MALPTASDNVFPKVILEEGAAPATPASGQVKIYAKADGLVYSKDDAGTETGPFGGSGVADIVDIPTAETDDTLVLAPDGAGGVEFRAEAGGGGGGATIQYPALKPATPTYDFAGASLDGAFSAHSSQGSFVTGNVMTQGIDWMGSSVELQFSAQMGQIYVAHADTDLDFSVGGIRYHLQDGSGASMFGIAALNSAGTGVGIVSFTDNKAYFATMTTWNYVTSTDSWDFGGHNGGSGGEGEWWLRLKRVSGTWTGYVSRSGRAWDKVFSTRSDSITVDKLVFGLLYNASSAYSGRLTADYFHVAV